MNLSQEDVGSIGQIDVQYLSGPYSFTVRVIMSITAPKGRMLLFSPLPDNRPNEQRQCEAIRAFMEEHKDD